MKTEKINLIFTNNNYEEWLEDMVNSMEEEECKEDFNYERYAEDCEIWLGDERTNLNIPIEGCIVCFGVLDLWDGKHNGGKIIGNNVRDILQGFCGDYITMFCDRYNVRCKDSHHDGTNEYLYRIAKDKETAKRLVDKVAYEGMTEEAFRKATRSVRPFIAKVYGW